LRFLEGWEGEIALALLDITLQGKMDGFEVCRKLRSDPHTSAIPVLFFTANSTPENRTLAREAGGQGFLAKPFSYDELLREVKRVTAPKQQGGAPK